MAEGKKQTDGKQNTYCDEKYTQWLFLKPRTMFSVRTDYLWLSESSFLSAHSTALDLKTIFKLTQLTVSSLKIILV